MDWKKLKILIAAGTFIVMASAYLGAAQRYTAVYFPNTRVNGEPVGGLTPDEAGVLVTADARDYVLTLQTRTGEEQISGEAFDLRADYGDSLDRLLEEQNPYLWFFFAVRGRDVSVETAASFDEAKLTAAVNALACMDADSMEAPEDAGISAYQANVGYELIPEKPGTTLDRDAVQEAVRNAVGSFTRTLSLEEAGAYVQPQVTSEDAALLARFEELNLYAPLTVTYVFGTQKVYLEGYRIHSWLSEDVSGQTLVDETQAAAFVKELADRYDTAYQPKEFQTSYGTTVTISKGNYGWQIDQKAETAALKEIILSGQGQEREPVYRQTAASHDGADYGNTYVEVNLTAQHLFFYVSGQLVVESDFVSGNESRGRSTPEGAYPLTYKQRNATLRGQGYASPVSYWMPFNRGVGLHDAKWRGTFGGSIYKTGGSHGCINLPANVARTIYENIRKGDPVLCYRLPGTESSATTKAAQYEYVEFHRE